MVPEPGQGETLSAREILRHKYGLPPFAVLYCCFNQLYKLEPATFRCWAQIIREVPNSMLWLLRFPPLGVPHINEALAREGLPQERLIWMDVAEKVPPGGSNPLGRVEPTAALPCSARLLLRLAWWLLRLAWLCDGC